MTTSTTNSSTVSTIHIPTTTKASSSIGKERRWLGSTCSRNQMVPIA
nr:unnamed protein product [Callosobruchus analis]